MPLIQLLVGLLAATSQAAAADPARPGKTAPELPTAQQAETVKTAMAASLEAQRASISRQVSQSASGSFFLLPPPPAVARTLVPRFADADCEPLPKSTLDPLINQAAEQQHLQPELLRSLIQHESGFRPCAVSPKGAIGLTQLMPSTAATLGVSDPFDPKENIDAGAKFLKQLLVTYHDLPTALGAYNAGPARIAGNGGVLNIPETIQYVKRILASMPVSY